MHQITININHSIYEHIMFFLKSLPKNLIQIESEIEVKKQPKKTSTSKENSIFSKTSGLLSSQNIDPLEWQNKVRNEWEGR